MASFANTIKNNIIDRFDYTKLNFINKLFFGAKEIKYENDKFIENNLEINKKSVTGGISSGLSSSYTIYKNNKKYTLDFNLNDEDFEDFKIKILEFIDSFYQEVIELEKTNYFNDYQ